MEIKIDNLTDIRTQELINTHLFESTAHFLQSEIQSVFHSFRKSVVNPNLCPIISPRGEKCGLIRSK